MKKIYLFIDGSNLYAGQYELFGPHRYLSFLDFISQVEKKLKIKFAKIYFYASYSPKPKRLTRKAEQYLKMRLYFINLYARRKIQFSLRAIVQKQVVRKKRLMSSWQLILSISLIGINIIQFIFCPGMQISCTP